LFDSPTVSLSAALVKRVAKTAVGGLPTKRRTMNAQESQIGVAEIERKMRVMVARHPRRYETRAATCKDKKTDKFCSNNLILSSNSLRRSECLMVLHRGHLPFPQRRPLPHGQWRAANRHAMESQKLGYVSVNVNVNASGNESASGCPARVHSNIIVNVNVSLGQLLCTLGICRWQVPMPLRR